MIFVTPMTMSVAVGKTLQFTDTVTGSSNMAVTWTVAGGSGNGTITATGLYTAPATVPNPAMVTVTATSQADPTKSASGIVTVATTTSAVSVTVSPAAPNVATFGTQQFTVSVTGTSNTAVTWEVNGITGGNRSVGFISSAGLYVAPGGVPTKSDGQGGTTTTTLAVMAISQADTNASGTAAVKLIPANQNAQAGAILLGASGGNANDFSGNKCCSGTLGSLVTRGGSNFVLSNNHVLARSDAGVAGEAIINPGLADINCDKTQGTTVANLTQFVNLENEILSTTPANNIDAAIAQVVAGKVDTSGNIFFLGATADGNGVPVPAAPHAGAGVAPSVGMAVAKSGRATGLTCSSVGATNIITSVDYNTKCDGTGTAFTVPYAGLVSVTGGSFSAEGDSGSLIVSQTTADPVALLFAGSDTDTVGNPVSPVLDSFASGSNALTFVGGGTHAVIGCSLPNAPQSAATTLQSATLSTDTLQKATTVRDAHVTDLMAHPEVQAVGVGASLDNASDPAILFFVTRGMSHTDIPAQVGGVRTRIVEGDVFTQRGALSAEQSSALEQTMAPAQAMYAISDAEFQRAQTVHAAHASELIKQPGIQGVGITSSADSAGEAALMIFVTRGVAHDPIPAVIDGVRTRVRETNRFRAGNWGKEPQHACVVPPTKNTKVATRHSAAAKP
jgi:hypothetical protein